MTPISPKFVFSVIRMMERNFPFWKFDLEKIYLKSSDNCLIRLTASPTAHCQEDWERNLLSVDGRDIRLFVEVPDSETLSGREFCKAAKQLLSKGKSKQLNLSEINAFYGEVSVKPKRPIRRSTKLSLLKSIEEFNYLVSRKKDINRLRISNNMVKLPTYVRSSLRACY